MKQYLVEIVKYGDPEEIVKRMGPMSKRKADRVNMGANINLNHEDYYTCIVPVENKKCLCGEIIPSGNVMCPSCTIDMNAIMELDI